MQSNQSSLFPAFLRGLLTPALLFSSFEVFTVSKYLFICFGTGLIDNLHWYSMLLDQVKWSVIRRSFHDNIVCCLFSNITTSVKVATIFGIWYLLVRPIGQIYVFVLLWMCKLSIIKHITQLSLDSNLWRSSSSNKFLLKNGTQAWKLMNFILRCLCSDLFYQWQYSDFFHVCLFSEHLFLHVFFRVAGFWFLLSVTVLAWGGEVWEEGTVWLHMICVLMTKHLIFCFSIFSVIYFIMSVQ